MPPSGGRVGPSPTTLALAQDLVLTAWETGSRARRVTIAKKALALSEDCADAWSLLASETARTPEDAIELYRKAVAAAERALGPEAFTEYLGHFWGVLETRPYMRARHGLATAQWDAGQYEEAVDGMVEMLRLDPNDSQGVRYLLVAWLLELGRHEELDALLAGYEGEIYAGWAYARALLAFRRDGECDQARALLDAAMAANPLVPDYLLGRRGMPRHLPETIGIGDDSEAVTVAADFTASWYGTPGARDWLRERAHVAGQLRDADVAVTRANLVGQLMSLPARERAAAAQALIDSLDGDDDLAGLTLIRKH